MDFSQIDARSQASDHTPCRTILEEYVMNRVRAPYDSIQATVSLSA